MRQSWSTRRASHVDHAHHAKGDRQALYLPALIPNLNSAKNEIFQRPSTVLGSVDNYQGTLCRGQYFLDLRSLLQAVGLAILSTTDCLKSPNNSVEATDAWRFATIQKYKSQWGSMRSATLVSSSLLSAPDRRLMISASLVPNRSRDRLITHIWIATV